MGWRYFLIFVARLLELESSILALDGCDTQLLPAALSHLRVTHRPSWQVLGLPLPLSATFSGTNSRKDILSEQIRRSCHCSLGFAGRTKFLPEIKNTCRGVYMCHQNPPQKVNSESW